MLCVLCMTNSFYSSLNIDTSTRQYGQNFQYKCMNSTSGCFVEKCLDVVWNEAANFHEGRARFLCSIPNGTSSMISFSNKCMLSNVKKSYLTDNDFYAQYFLQTLRPSLEDWFFLFQISYAILLRLPANTSLFSFLFLLLLRLSTG